MNESKLDRLQEIEKEIDALIKERSDINNELSEERKAKNLARVRSWQINDKSCLLLFAKKPSGYHWWIAKTIKVKEIDFDNEYIDSIEANYGEADYEYYVKVEERRIPFSSLEELEKEFNIYFVDEVQLTLLQQHFCNLKIDYKNYQKYEDAFSKNAMMAIKIPLK